MIRMAHPAGTREPILKSVSENNSRRHVLRVGLLATVGLALTGCATGTSSRNMVGKPIPGEGDPEALPPRRPAGGVASGPTPGVIARTQWTRATPVMANARPMGRVSRITIHHDGMTPFTSRRQGDAVSRLESIRRAHVSLDGWADIGYHFAIDPAGRVYECRPLNLQGAHAGGDANIQNLGIVVLGNYMSQQPTPETLSSLYGFVSSQMRRFRIPVSGVYTHQELKPTACPGVSLQRMMVQARDRRGALSGVA